MKNIEDDNGCNTSGNETFQDVLDARVSRRGLISSGLAAADFLSLGGVASRFGTPTPFKYLRDTRRKC